MSLIGELVRTARGLRGEATPPVPYTGAGSPFSVLGGGTEPIKRHLDLTTVESTLFSVLDLISSDIGAVEWGLYRNAPRVRTPIEEQRPLTSSDHLAAKLWDQPNDFMTGEQVRTVVEWHYDAVGEGWMVCQYNAVGIPESYWWVRPDRMKPVTDPGKYLLGYQYTGPNGERIPLEINEVLRITRPHPLDPHRGIGAVQALTMPLSTSLTAQQWIEAFYRNDATPGGIIELGQEELMEADDYRKLVSRWNDQHQGVRRAHRVGILEIGSFKPMAVDFQKLQVTEMRQLTRDQVLEAYRIHKHMLGASDDVNRANAVAADTTYARRTLKPRVRTWTSFANGPYLATFGVTGSGVQFCPENVVPEDDEAENAERVSKASAAATLRSAGWNPDDVLMTVGLPPMRWEGSGNGSSAPAPE